MAKFGHVSQASHLAGVWGVYPLVPLAWELAFVNSITIMQPLMGIKDITIVKDLLKWLLQAFK